MGKRFAKTHSQNASPMYPTAPSALTVFDVGNAGMTCMPFLTNLAWFAYETAREALSPQTLATLENTARKHYWNANPF